jgi:hypothetical protein
LVPGKASKLSTKKVDVGARVDCLSESVQVVIAYRVYGAEIPPLLHFVACACVQQS